VYDLVEGQLQSVKPLHEKNSRSMRLATHYHRVQGSECLAFTPKTFTPYCLSTSIIFNNKTLQSSRQLASLCTVHGHP